MAEAFHEYTLLWWTRWFNEEPFENRVIDNCGLPYQCRMTHNRSRYNQSKVILFHAPDVTGAFSKPGHQDLLRGDKAFVLYSLEAPQYVEYDERLVQMFSHRWSTWRGSDFPDSYFVSGVNGLLKDVLQKPRVALAEKNRRRNLPREQGGIAPVSWIVSNCYASNSRKRYVQELAKHIDVDIYGLCEPNKPWPQHPDGTMLTADEVVAPYKFYLSFENSNCDDYVTEKLHRPLLLGNVPVVDGPKNYSRFSPTKNALIQTDNFANAALLAKYLKELDSDDEAYLDHLRYKVPKDPSHTPTLQDLSPSFVSEWYNEERPEDWGFDGHGTNCKVCKLAHDLEEGIYKLDADKRVAIDNTCQRRKHASVIEANDDGVPLHQDSEQPPPTQQEPQQSPPVQHEPQQPSSLPSNLDKGELLDGKGDSSDTTDDWPYLYVLPILVLAVFVLIIFFSRKLRRLFFQPKASTDKAVLLNNMYP